MTLSGSRDDKATRIPAELHARAEALVDEVAARTLSAARWNTTAVMRLGLDWGLAYIEGLIERGEPLAPPPGAEKSRDGK